MLAINRHSFYYLNSAAQMSNHNVLPNPSVLMLSSIITEFLRLSLFVKKYLFVIENYILKILMTNLRLGLLNLEIVLSRYEGIPCEERFCKLCDSGLVEDEMHFVLVCNYFINERQSFIPRYYREHPSEFKFCQLLQCSENSSLNN